MRKRLIKKCLVYACIGALAIANLPAGNLPAAQVSAAEETVKEVKLQLGQDGVDKVGPQSVSGGYAYQGGFSIPEGVTSEYKFLAITYVGDISSLRLAGKSTTWFAENPEGTFKTADGSDIVLNAETETTVVIDLEKSGVSYVGGDFIHLHAGNGTDFTYEFKSVTLRTAAEPGTEIPPVEGKSVALQLAQDGVNKVGPQSVSGGYAYQGGFSIPEGVTAEYKFLEITYVGDISSLRLAGKSTTWFAENPEGTFKTADDSEIVLNAETETTVVIDLEKSGVSYVGGDFIHLHAGNGTDFTYEFKSVNLKTTATVPIEIPSTPEVTDPQETESPEPTTPADVATGIQLNGDDKGASAFNGTYHIDKAATDVAYKYLGFVTFKDLATKDFKYLKFTYTGDITGLRLEFIQLPENNLDGPYWFNPEQDIHFVGKDGMEIPMVGNNTTVVIDLEASGVDMSKFNSGFHMHGESTVDAAFDVTIKDAVLYGGIPTPKETTANPTTPKNKVKAPGKTKVKSASKKKASTKVKISLKKVKSVKGYNVQISASKKFKKVLVKKNVKKVKFTIKSKKIKNKKKLYVRARAYKLNGKKKVYGKWTKAKKIKIKK